VKVTLHVEVHDFDLVALIRIASMKGTSLDDVVYDAIRQYIDAEMRKVMPKGMEVTVPEKEEEKKQ